MKNYTTQLCCLIVLFTFSFSLPIAAQHNQWVKQSSGLSSNLYGVFFVDESTGWAVGASGKILHTNNGGTTWAEQTSGTNDNFRAVYFVSSSTGWAVGDTGTILHTSNGGATWNAQTTGPEPFGNYNSFSDVYFTDASNGWAVGSRGSGNGDNGIVFRTTDGGNTWSNQVQGSARSFTNIHFAGGGMAWITGGDHRLLRSEDNGDTWSVINTGLRSVSTGLKNVYFTDADNGWIIGNSNGKIIGLKTSDSGNTWDTIVNNLSAPFHTGVHFFNSTTAYAVKGSRIEHTTDGGVTWVTDTTVLGSILDNTDFSFHDILFINANKGWSVGGRGNIWHYNGVGIVSTDNIVSERVVVKAYPNPTNATATIEFTLNQSQPVTLQLFNLQGKQVASLLNETIQPGTHQVTFDSNELPKGLYIYQLQTGSNAESGKIFITN